MWTAQWIWNDQEDYKPYQQAVFFLRKVELPELREARLHVAVDGQYRLFVNGEWIQDGPARSYPNHMLYDSIDLSSWLEAGENEILILARHWNVGTMHGIPLEAGLLAQLDATPVKGKKIRIGTDRQWLAAEVRSYIPNTPKVFITMGPQEEYDARQEDLLDFAPAAERYAAKKGPWKGLSPRTIPFLTKEPVGPLRCLGTRLVKKPEALQWTFNPARLNHPDLVETNFHTSIACALASQVEVGAAQTLQFDEQVCQVYVDGKRNASGRYTLKPGRHSLVVFPKQVFRHMKEVSFRLNNPPAGLTWKNPVDAKHRNPWVYVRYPEYNFARDDMLWFGHRMDPRRQSIEADFDRDKKALLKAIRAGEKLADLIGDRAECMKESELFLRDSWMDMFYREELGDASGRVENPEACMTDTASYTVVHPDKKGDVEILYDLGEQNVGYYDLDFVAEEGTVVDVYGVEYIDEENRIQHTVGNPNNVRYTAREGVNRFLSIHRRSGRYLFVTFRNHKKPVRLRNLRLVAATYPVEPPEAFQCSDPNLDRIWEISNRTLKLCMEDSFTDCPLYERTLWIGDARNEALFAYPVFGAEDLARRCLEIGRQSLEHFPMVGSQVPSGWENVLPIWSFLWGIGVWDHYYYTGDRAFLEDFHPAVMENLKNAAEMIDESGLFSAPFWNLFDWAPIAHEYDTVLHNSFFFVGALETAEKGAELLKRKEDLAWIQSTRKGLVKALNAQWDAKKKAYFDSLDDEFQPVRAYSQHTSMLSLLYGVAPKNRKAELLKNMLKPPKDMVKIGSPFAMLYYYEALEKAGEEDRILDSIRDCYLPMLQAGATTVWEVFPGSTCSPEPFPTRSHCHAWSSAPSLFLPRILLGVKMEKPGGEAVSVSPRLNGLTWAKGSVQTAQGLVSVSWKKEGTTLHVEIESPKGVAVRFVRNETHKGLDVKVHKGGPPELESVKNNVFWG